MEDFFPPEDHDAIFPTNTNFESWNDEIVYRMQIQTVQTGRASIVVVWGTACRNVRG